MREVPVAEWQSFLDQFSRDHRAWLATVERVPTAGARQIAAAGRPLQAILPEVRDQRLVAIAIEFQGDSSEERKVTVMHPMRVRVYETGASRALEIEDERGDRTRLRFRSVPVGEMLDGLAPGEV
jgi:hypothetical protein